MDEEGAMGMRTRRGAAIGLAGVLMTVLSLVAINGSLATGAGASTPRNTIPPAPFMTFGGVPVGASAGPGNTGLMNGFYVGTGQTVTINLSTDVIQSGPGAGDYTLVPSTGCVGAGTGTITLPGNGPLCLMEVYFTPSALGDRSATMRINESDGGYESVGLSGTGTPSLSFGDTTLGTYSGPDTFALFNKGSSTDTIDLSTGMSLSGPGADDYVVTPSSGCAGDGVNTVIIAPSSACTMNASFYPGTLGDRSATVTIQGSVGTGWSVNLSGNGTIGYYQVDAQGNVANTGDAGYFGDAGSMTLNKPIVGMAATGDDGGYWLVASDGGIFNYGDANFYGSTGAIHLNKPIVGMAGTPDAGGYWLVATDGGIFSYGDAQFYGSTGSIHLNKPIVGMAPTPDGRGYWLVASDGGIFSYGHAQFYGSTGAIHLAQPIVAMAAMPTGGGYWFSAADGGLFNYGDAPFLGSGVGIGLGAVVDMTSDGAPTLQAFADIPAVRQAHVSGLGPAARHVPRFAGP